MSTFIDLNRASYLKASPSPDRLNYLSAKYKNIRFNLKASQSFTLTNQDIANAPGIAFSVYGDVGYWWVICMFNGVISPIEDLVPGATLQLPSLSDLNAYLTSQDQSLINTITI